MRNEPVLVLGVLVLGMMFCGLVFTYGPHIPGRPMLSDYWNSPEAAIVHSECVASELMSRRDALLRYVLAMHSPDGYFHAFACDAPLEGRFGLYPSIFDIDEGYSILDMLNSTYIVDWTPSISILRSLVNGLSSSPALRGLINTSARTGPSAGTESYAVGLFYALGIGDELDLDTIATYVAAQQMDSGGFREAPDALNPPDLIETYFAVRLLVNYGYQHLFDVDGVLEFVLRCYNSDGGVGERPGLSSDFEVLPLALLTLDLFDRLDLIDRELTLQYLVGQWNNRTGCHRNGHIVSTERAIWCFYLLSALDRIDQKAAVDWILRCQSQEEGAFRVYPGEQSDRLYFCRVAVHALSLLGRLDALDSPIEVWNTPKWEVPQWYLDKIASETTTVTTEPIVFTYWRVKIFKLYKFLVDSWPIGTILLCLIPALYWLAEDNQRRARARIERKMRGPGRTYRRVNSHDLAKYTIPRYRSLKNDEDD